MRKQEERNRYFFGLGTIGRDMLYAFKTNTLLYFLSNVLSLPIQTFAAASLVLSLLRIVSAVNDPIIGMVIDNIQSPWGKLKPAILAGGIGSAVLSLVIFSDIGTGAAYILVFALVNVLWDLCYGFNDIAYWTMLPALSAEQRQREKNGAFARLCANAGCYIALIFWEPATSALGNTPGAWFRVAAFISAVYLAGLCFPLFGVKERGAGRAGRPRSTAKKMWKAMAANDQLMWLALMIVLNAVCYFLTLGFAAYYMQYLYGDRGMYAVLSAVGGAGQILAMALFPMLSRFSRSQILTAAIFFNILGYILFIFADSSMLLVAAAAVLVYFCQAVIQLLEVLFMADTIEYGQWKLGERNEAVTFSAQTLANKVASALATGIVSVTVVLAGIKRGNVAAESISMYGALTVKTAMCVVPIFLLLCCYYIFRKKYVISQTFYKRILKDLKERDSQ